MKRTQRWIALLLTLAMALTLVPPVLAAEEVQTEPVAVEAVDAEGAEPVEEPIEEAAEEAEEAVAPQAITAIDLSNAAEVTVNNDQTTYTGKAIEPNVSVKCNDKWLQAGTDYQLHDGQGNALNIVDAGQYTLCIEGIGAYTGRAYATFTVKPKGLFVKETVTFDNQIKIKLSWEDCGGASCRYSVLYSDDGEHYQSVARGLSECSWTDDGSLTGGIDQEKNRWYQVKVDYSDVTATVEVWPSQLRPYVRIRCESEAEGIWAKWYPDDGALYYRCDRHQRQQAQAGWRCDKVPGQHRHQKRGILHHVRHGLLPDQWERADGRGHCPGGALSGESLYPIYRLPKW